MTELIAVKWRVAADRAVIGPGGRTWSGAPSHAAAYNLANTMAGIDAMLTGIARPALTVIPDQIPEYGCYRVPSKAH